jgi:hypothetical protein
MKLPQTVHARALLKLTLCVAIFAGVFSVIVVFHYLGATRQRELTEAWEKDQPQRIIVVGKRMTAHEKFMYDMVPVNNEETEFIGPPIQVGD